jgi:hypothetical protein
MATSKVKTAPVEHKDKLGRLLRVGDCVAYPDRNSLTIGTINKITPKMTMVIELGATRYSWRQDGVRKYPGDLVLLEGPEVTMYLLKMNATG